MAQTFYLANLIKGICQILKIKKVNTSGYHPQTDGLVEKFNSTLTNMLAKSAEKNSNWDTHLPFLLFAYRATVQESVRESPFYLLYGRDPRLPTKDLQKNTPNYAVDVDDYKSTLTTYLSEAWSLANKPKSNRRKCMTNTPNSHGIKSVIELWYSCQVKRKDNMETSQAILWAISCC